MTEFFLSFANVKFVNEFGSDIISEGMRSGILSGKNVNISWKVCLDLLWQTATNEMRENKNLIQILALIKVSMWIYNLKESAFVSSYHKIISEIPQAFPISKFGEDCGVFDMHAW